MKSKDFWPLFKYIIAGGIAFLVDIIALYILVEYFDIYYILAVSLAFIANLSVNYIISRHFIFTKTDRSSKQSYAYFFGISLLGLTAINLFMLFSVEILGIHYIVARIAIAATLGVGSFFIHKHITFKVKQWENDSEIFRRVKKKIRKLTNKEYPTKISSSLNDSTTDSS